MKIVVLCVIVLACSAVPGRSQELRAQLSPRDFTTLAAEIGAKVNTIAVREGERFAKGDVLVDLDCSIQQAQLAEARAALTAARKTVAVNRRLLQLQTIGSLENDLALAEQEKALARVTAGEAIIAKCSVAAPFAGRVAEQKVHAQQYVQPGQPMLDILDDSVLEVEFIAPSRWLAWLKPGHEFGVDIDETGTRYPVKLIRIGARIDPVSQSVKVAGAISGRYPELLAGMSGTVLLTPP